MDRKEFLNRLEELLERPANSLSGPEDLESLGWDSMRSLEFLALADEIFDGAELPPMDFDSVKVVDDLVKLLGTRIA